MDGGGGNNRAGMLGFLILAIGFLILPGIGSVSGLRVFIFSEEACIGKSNDSILAENECQPKWGNSRRFHCDEQGSTGAWSIMTYQSRDMTCSGEFRTQRGRGFFCAPLDVPFPASVIVDCSTTEPSYSGLSFGTILGIVVAVIATFVLLSIMWRYCRNARHPPSPPVRGDVYAPLNATPVITPK